VRVRCPVCRQEAEYPERYAGRWHRCRAGCPRYPGTRLRLDPGGEGTLAEDVDTEEEARAAGAWLVRDSASDSRRPGS